MTDPSPPSGRLDAPRLRSVLRPPPSGPGGRSGIGDAAPEGGRQAAVALVFAPGTADTELLFIQRATAEGDPWSGQMALPGGRVDPGDPDTVHTAIRETAEEVGVDLDGAERLGALADLEGGRITRRVTRVSAHAFWLPTPTPTSPNYEVAEALWVPMAHLLDRGRYIDYHHPAVDDAFPGIQLDNPEQVVWGLTLRLLADLMARLGHPFLLRPDD
ncbi:MAG: CoA pyrophosphatase [Actinomycetota bacterium]